MGVPSKPLPTLGGNNTTEDPKIREALQELQSILTGGVDSSNLSAGLLGSSDNRLKSVIAGEDTITSTSAVAAATPDRVVITTAADALIEVRFEALFRFFHPGNPLVQPASGWVQMFVDGTAMGSPVALAEETSGFTYGGGSTTSKKGRVETNGNSFLVVNSLLVGSDQTFPLPGFRQSSPMLIEAAAGSHTIEARYTRDASSFSGTQLMVSSRKMRVRSVAY